MTAKLNHFTQESSKMNMTILLGHYPMSVVNIADSFALKSALRNCTAYLCGHLHSLHGRANTMHILHETGHLELELADWKDNRRFRIVAIDHDLFSFGDFTFGKWPIVIITNPKDAHYISARESWQKMVHSTHIRVLAFSPSPIQSVHISIDNGVVSAYASHVRGPLHTLLWSPSSLKPGLHEIKVEITDESGRTAVKVQKFSLDGTRAYFDDVLTAFVLLTDFCILVRTLDAILANFSHCVFRCKKHLKSGFGKISRDISIF
eukprot:m.154559 g.154559  ORF g.154559 m.154559 type:complete len:263 (+) comp38641_c0_seq42:1153-1941(+)